ncbi:MAG: ATP-binding protein [Candidatus Puniceispirillaceae bacterium]
MSNAQIVVLVAVCYTIALFAVAYWADRAAKSNRKPLLSSPLIYTLSLSVYCTAWTFYGAVGSAARNGFEFLAIYLGPTIIFVGWWWFLRRLVKIGRTEKLTSIADFVSARYGKSVSLAAIATLIALIGVTPYIALQLQSLTLSFSVFAQTDQASTGAGWQDITTLSIAIGLAIFIALFGTRNLNASERHEGVVTAIALEAVVKLIALVTVGIAVCFWIIDDPTPILSDAVLSQLESNSIFSSRWATLICLSAFAIFSLPRMFQVLVVENQSERQLALASWAFPGYLLLMCLFVMPIALFGLGTGGADANPDLFVLTVPLSQGYDGLAILAFLGGFSSATSMVIVAALALATMVSNHLVLPLIVKSQGLKSRSNGDLRTVTKITRRLTIFLILMLGYFYYRLTGGTEALASIGLISFLGVSQIVPPLFGGMIWRGATKRGAIAGVITGFILWAYTSFLPSFEGRFILSNYVIENGLFGLWLLQPQALFGSTIQDPLVHAFIWSLGSNCAVFLLVSLATKPSDMERLQFAVFQAQPSPATRRSLFHEGASAHELLALSQRILGQKDGSLFFRDAASAQGLENRLPAITTDFLETLEREFASLVGAATAQAMLSPFVGRGTLSVSEIIALADEQAALRTYSEALEEKSKELTDTAVQLRAANMQLVHLGQQRDQFLTSVSHELRTPMTSIRSFSEILKSEMAESSGKSAKFATIIHDESLRLTKLLDEILDISFLESGQPVLHNEEISLREILNRADAATAALQEENGARLHISQTDIIITTDPDRLVQPVINLIANAIKHNKSEPPEVWLEIVDDPANQNVMLKVQDNGQGIPALDQIDIFEKFATAGTGGRSGVGLGLPISAQIIKLLHGSIEAKNNDIGACFIITLPYQMPHKNTD